MVEYGYDLIWMDGVEDKRHRRGQFVKHSSSSRLVEEPLACRCCATCTETTMKSSAFISKTSTLLSHLHFPGILDSTSSFRFHWWNMVVRIFFSHGWMTVMICRIIVFFSLAGEWAARSAFVCAQNSSHVRILVERTKQPRLGGSDFGSCKNSLVLSSAAG